MEPIAVRYHGASGPVLVVLHGGPAAPGSVSALASALADGFRVLEPFQRRSGEVPLTVAQHVADLAAAVDAPATVIGWSWGAMLGLAFAAAHPELVRALVLIGCATFDAASRALYDAAIHERGDDRPLRPRGADTRHGRCPAHATSSSWRRARGSQPTPDTA